MSLKLCAAAFRLLRAAYFFLQLLSYLCCASAAIICPSVCRISKNLSSSVQGGVKANLWNATFFFFVLEKLFPDYVLKCA